MSFACLVLVVLAPSFVQRTALPFDAAQVQLPLDSAPFQRLFDFDGDGDLDAVGGRVRVLAGVVNGYETRVWRNDGAGAFTLAWSEFVESAPGSSSPGGFPIAVGDLDGDGRADFVQAAGTDLLRYRSAPGEAFEKTSVSGGAPLVDVELADFDGDGKDDVALLGAQFVAILWAEPSRGHRLPAGQPFHAFARISGNTKLVVCDTDGDPLPDLLAVASGTWTPLWIEERRLRPLASWSFAHANPMVDAGDVDGDGDEDVAAFHSGTVEVFQRVGASQWVRQAEHVGGPAEFLADLDGDGDDDGVCCSGGGGGGGSGALASLDFASNFEISLNTDGVFAPAFTIPGVGSRSLAGARDVDGDGRTDLVAGRCVYFQRESWSPRVVSDLDWVWGEEVLADLDGDGDLDATSEPTYYPFDGNVYRNQGDGHFAWGTLDLDAPGGSLQAGRPRLTGDFDGDGDADFILGVWDPALGRVVHFGLWRNLGEDRFRYAGAAMSAAAPYNGSAVGSHYFLIGDVQADGDLDVVFVFYYSSYNTFVYLNDGSGAFSLGASYVQQGAVTLADLDQDGLQDLLMYGGLRHGQASGSPFGGLRQEFRYAGSADPNEVLVRDFNQDGSPDVLLLSSTLPPSGCVLLNGLPLGAGPAFVSGWLPEVLPGAAARLQALDVDLDGRSDLLIGPYVGSAYSNQTRTYRYYRGSAAAPANLGPQGFVLMSEFVYDPGDPVYGVPDARLPCLDVDGDGDLDALGQTLLRCTTH